MPRLHYLRQGVNIAALRPAGTVGTIALRNRESSLVLSDCATKRAGVALLRIGLAALIVQRTGRLAIYLVAPMTKALRKHGDQRCKRILQGPGGGRLWDWRCHGYVRRSHDYVLRSAHQT